jgi:hypothetical protein
MTNRTPTGILSSLLATVACLALTLPASAAEPVKAWKGGERGGVKTKHLHMPLSNEEFYTDRYTAEAWFEDGSRLWVSFLVNNFGPGTGKMKVRARFIEKGGKEHYVSDKVDSDDYTVDNGDSFSVSAKAQKLSGKPRNIKVKGKAGKYSWNLTFKSGLKPFRPGTGRTEFGTEGGLYYDHTLVQPKAVVTGKVNGAATKGYGYVIHTHGNIAPFNMFKNYIQVRSIDGDTVVWFHEFVTPAKYGGKRVGYLYVAHKGEKIIGTSYFKRKLADMKTDTKHSNKYKIPMRILVQAKSRKAEVQVKLAADKIIGRQDELKSRNAFEAALIKQYAQPVAYTMSSKLQVTFKKGDAEPVEAVVDGQYELNHLNR